MIVCPVWGYVVVVVGMFDSGEVQYEVTGHHVRLELGRAARDLPLPRLADQSLTALARRRAAAVARRIAR